MQGVLKLHSEHVTKRQKALRACQQCKYSKKRCNRISDSPRCERCDIDGWPCSFENTPQPIDTGARRPLGRHNGSLNPSSTSKASTHAVYTEERSVVTEAPSRFTGPDIALSPDTSSQISNYVSIDPPSHTRHSSRPTKPAQLFATSPDWESSNSNLHPHPLPATPATSASESTPESRYATMLSIMEHRDAGLANSDSLQGFKLISGTNPLSALLGKDLKHTIVTNSCSFRTPDPSPDAIKRPPWKGRPSIHNCDWEQLYRDRRVSEPRLQYLRATGCFQLPPAARCAELLDTFFTYIHPMLPVIDRKDFLLSYYGSDETPPLIVLHAVFLAASRYMPGDGLASNSASEIRSLCDELHAKVRALMDIDISHERLAVIQASLIASLHWEGREGLNSAIDSLSLAVRGCQEMGLHRKTETLHSTVPINKGLHSVHRRIWWSVYMLDRFCAAQEGTPFLINKEDCDVEFLTENDLTDESYITVRATFINLSIAALIDNAVRCLYAPGRDNNTLFSTQGVTLRQRLILQVEELENNIHDTLISGQGVENALEEAPQDVSVLCGAILLTHLDAVRILIHRPFILYSELCHPHPYTSRVACRQIAGSILSRLNLLLKYDLLQFSWPFTVYAVVNCLLIYWYDISSQPPMAPAALQAARKDYSGVVNLLRVMGNTWWAAAAKHKLALALARVAGRIQSNKQQDSSDTWAAQRQAVNTTAESSVITDSDLNTEYGKSSIQHSREDSEQYGGVNGAFENELFFDSDNIDYWSSLGLDFDMDVAGNIFSIEQLGNIL